MTFDHHHYVPCLRWKQGEYQALLNLSDSAKDVITPLIEVSEINFDFETQRPVKSLDEHLAFFVKRIKPKWESRQCFVDLKHIDASERMSDGQHPVKYVFDELRSKKCTATPVIGLDRDSEYLRAAQEALSKDQRGACFRISIVDAARQGLGSKLKKLLSSIDLKVEESDLILDLGSPNFEPLEGFATAVQKTVSNLPDLERWRTFTLIGSSFPEIGSIERGATTVPRYEWRLYKLLVRKFLRSGTRLPTFGDYAINRLEVLQLDMRFVKPNATVKYTIDDSWLIIKGLNVKDHKFGQYKDHSQTVINSQFYSGPTFSEGDEYIYNCAAGGKTGNLTVWIRVGTSHHLEKLVTDIANFVDSLDTP